MCSAAGPQPAAVAAPAVPTILKKSRRFTSASVMTRHAVHGRSRPARSVLLTVAFDAPAHAQGWAGWAHAHEVHEVVAEPGAGAGGGRGHGLHGAVTRLALEPGADVRLVREIRELGELVDALPRNRLVLGGELGELLDLGTVGSRDLVTPHAAGDRRQSRILRASGIGVAVLAV